MKSVVTFVLGAVLAGGVAYFAMRKPSEPAPAAAPVASVAPAAVTPYPAAEAPAPEPLREPEPVAQPKRSAMPGKPVRSAPVARSLPPAAAPAAAQPTPQEPAAVAQTPPSPPPVTIERPRMEERQPEPPPRVPRTITVPAGTTLSVRIDETLSSEKNRAGDSFRAILDQPLAVDGLVVAERGARVMGKVIDSDRAGRVKGVALLTLELTQLNTSDGQKVKIQTETFNKHGETSKKADGVKIGAAAAIGAAIGAIAGGGKGAAIGAGAGGAAGTGGVMATRGKDAEVPVETKLSFRLRDAITLTERLH
ncbi:MAG: hypothetical protein ABJF23_28660 [Bryobacteraceae bacterium]